MNQVVDKLASRALLTRPDLSGPKLRKNHRTLQSVQSKYMNLYISVGEPVLQYWN